MDIDSESGVPRSTEEPLLSDYDEQSWFGEGGVPDPSRDPIAQAINLLAKPDTMGNLEALISESYKFIRMADDLHDVARYLNDMRLCFIALTITGYLVMIVYGIVFCVRRNRRRPAGVNNNGAARRGRWDYQTENRDYQTHTQTDDLVSVRSDGQGNTASYMGDENRGAAEHSAGSMQQAAGGKLGGERGQSSTATGSNHGFRGKFKQEHQFGAPAMVKHVIKQEPLDTIAMRKPPAERSRLWQ